MRDLSWTRRNEGQMQFSVRQTSRDRFWTGFSAHIYGTSGGFAEVLSIGHYGISMHIGTPIHAACRCDGAVSRRLQVPGDIDLIPIGHSSAWEDDGPTAVLDIQLSPALMRSTAEEIGMNPDRVSILPQLSLRDPHIEHIGWALVAELESEHPSGRLYADGLGLALTTHLLRRYTPAVTPSANGLPKRRLQRVIDYIQEHIAHNLTLAELAATVNMSQSHFKLLFRQSVGMPVHQYVIHSRVKYATELLLGSDLPLSDVALQAGFANQSHMARCMRRVTGLTPGALRDTA